MKASTPSSPQLQTDQLQSLPQHLQLFCQHLHFSFLSYQMREARISAPFPADYVLSLWWRFCPASKTFLTSPLMPRRHSGQDSRCCTYQVQHGASPFEQFVTICHACRGCVETFWLSSRCTSPRIRPVDFSTTRTQLSNADSRIFGHETGMALIARELAPLVKTPNGQLCILASTSTTGVSTRSRAPWLWGNFLAVIVSDLSPRSGNSSPAQFAVGHHAELQTVSHALLEGYRDRRNTT